ncbi:MAG: polysaccharide biosynthesis protein [Eubacteriales bacterium]|nr:polysaccharide biosynthesis protein [Eubacteriales bacterium]
MNRKPDNINHSLAEETVKKSRGMLLSGVLILTVANIAVKVFGFLYKVPLNRILGDEMANVNTAYSIYATLLVVSTAGIPSAVAMLISQSRAKGYSMRVKKVFSTALSFLTLIGFVLTIAMLIGARFVSAKNSGGDSFLCMCAIAPALFFVCMISVFRGYFQGFQIMTPTAISEIIESFSKMLLGLSFAYIALKVLNLGIEWAAAFSVLGISVGMGLGALYLAIALPIYSKKGLLHVDSCGNEKTVGKRKIIYDIARVSVPIALSSAVISMSGLIDSQFMRPLLEIYCHDRAYAKAVYSDYSTGAITLFNLPSILIYPIACAIIPFISSAIVANDRRAVREVSDSALRTSSLIAMPCALGLSVLSSPILEFVFRGDIDMAKNAGGLLRVLAIAVFFIGILAVSSAVLQAHGRAGKPIISMLAGLAVKIASVCILVPRIGAVGTPISTLLFYAVTVLFNMYFLFKYTGVVISAREVLLKPFVCSGLACCVAWGTYTFLSVYGNSVAVIFAIILAAVSYIALIFAFGCIYAKDVEKLPFGDKISRYLMRLKLIK